MDSPKSESKRIPKTHVKKKIYRAWVKEQTHQGKINAANGAFVSRANVPDISMRRDYHPQESK